MAPLICIVFSRQKWYAAHDNPASGLCTCIYFMNIIVRNVETLLREEKPECYSMIFVSKHLMADSNCTLSQFYHQFVDFMVNLICRRVLILLRFVVYYINWQTKELKKYTKWIYFSSSAGILFVYLDEACSASSDKNTWKRTACHIPFLWYPLVE